MKFNVTVTRIGYSTATIAVDAGSVEEAGQAALSMTPDHSFSEHAADYEVDAVSPVGS